MGIRDYLNSDSSLAKDDSQVPDFLRTQEPPRPERSLERQKYAALRSRADKPTEDLAIKMEDELKTITATKASPQNIQATHHADPPPLAVVKAYPHAEYMVESTEDDTVRSPLHETAQWMLLLTFNDFIKLATKIVKKDGYSPPTTPFELANLLNEWAIAECEAPGTKPKSLAVYS
jgi:hypothetical protein